MKKPNTNICTLTRRLSTSFASIILLSTASTCFAATDASNTANNTPAEIAYVDSVKKWGAWNLDIQPAAGGLQAPSSTQPLTARGTKLRLRTNSFTALAPVSSQGSPSVNSPTPPPVIPSPIGGPTDGLF